MPNTKIETKPKVVLAVDDSREMLDIFKTILVDAGYRFFGAGGARQGLRLIGEVQPNLILLDIQMPEMDGFEMCRQIRGTEASRNIPVAFVTARRTAADVKDGMDAGGNDFITKPFDGKTLLGRVDRWMPKEPQAIFRQKSA